MHSEKFKLDFRTKMLMSLCLSYTLILGNIQTKFSIVAAAYSLLPYVFLLLNREKKAAVKGILFIMAAYIIQKEWVFSAGGFLGSLFLFITMMFLRLLPGFVMARFALASSTMSHMTSALKKMHFPVVLIIPITVMARFFHTAREDYNQVKDAMYLHGLTNRRLFFHPAFIYYTDRIHRIPSKKQIVNYISLQTLIQFLVNHSDTVFQRLPRSGKTYLFPIQEDISFVFFIGTERTLHHR